MCTRSPGCLSRMVRRRKNTVLAKRICQGFRIYFEQFETATDRVSKRIQVELLLSMP